MIRLKKIIFIIAIIFVAFVCCGNKSLAATYYVDPDYTGGSNNGSQLTPWTSINWSTVNPQLASEDITIYFSARNDDADTDQVYAGTIDLALRTDVSSHLLIIDGNSYYNSNDANGSSSWVQYSGESKCNPKKINIRKGTSAKTSYVTVSGFNIIQTSSDKAIDICGDQITVENNDISHSGSLTNGPLIQFAPVADAAHQGSSVPCPQSTGFIFRNNNLSNSYGEMLYLGGGGSSSSGGRPPGTETWVACGYPAHYGFQVLDNTFNTGGILGGQGDAIDVKGGLRDLIISGNEIYNMSDSETRAIVLNGWQGDDTETNQNIVIEKNYIHDNTNWSEAISISNTWGGAQGVTIRNNIFDSNAVEGIRIYTDTDGATYYPSKWVYIYNNTFYNQATYGIQTDATSQITESGIKNNLFVNNNSGGNQVTWAGSIAESNNAFSNTFGETCTFCQTASASDFVNASGGNFNLSIGALSVNNGVEIASFSMDYAGTSRPQGSAWDIGAYEFVESLPDTTPPSAPSNLAVQ